MTEMMIGLDIGGTTVKIGILNGSGSIIEKWEIPTNTANKGISIVDDISNSVTSKLASLKIDKKTLIGIGVGAPGFIDIPTGFVYEAINIGWKNFDLGGLLKERFHLPVFINNDANVAVLGENWKGAGNQSRNLIAVTLGTGVGGGIIANGKILDGVNGTAGEIGHITVEPGGYRCNCGLRGCLETIASATGIVRQAMDKIAEYPKSDLAEFYKEEESLTTKDVFELAGKGDHLCEQILNRTADVLGSVIANTGLIINPSMVLIGGGVSKAGKPLLDLINKAFVNYALPRVSDVCEMKIAELGNDAGIIGAAFLVKQKLQGIEF